MEWLVNTRSFEQFTDSTREHELWAHLTLICDALQHAHDQNIVHRDLHEGNVVLADGCIKILDFGSALAADASFDFRPVGGIRTCSPEKLEDSKSVDGKSDVFSLGCMWYAVVKGSPPYFGMTFGDKIDKLRECDVSKLALGQSPQDVLLAETLQRDPKRRPSAGELASRLRKLARTG